MSEIVTRGLRRQSKLGIRQQPIHGATHSQEQPCFRTKRIQWIDVPNNEPQ
jgi:hypothetical protein